MKLQLSPAWYESAIGNEEHPYVTAGRSDLNPFLEETRIHRIAINRTPEEIAAARARAIAASPPPREIPEGKTLAEVVMGQWPGDETDEQILEALEKLS